MIESRIFGYARVSTQEQNLDRQINDLQQYVEKENILFDKVSGKNLDRPVYQALKGALGLRKGDVLYITSLDRLSRNKEDIKTELLWFKNHGITLKIIDLPTSMIEVPKGQEWILEMITNVLIEVLSSIAQQERITILQRQRAGIAAAKQKGKHLGRPPLKMPDNFEQQYLKWKKKGITAKTAMQTLGMAKSSFYKLVKIYENKNII